MNTDLHIALHELRSLALKADLPVHGLEDAFTIIEGDSSAVRPGVIRNIQVVMKRDIKFCFIACSHFTNDGVKASHSKFMWDDAQKLWQRVGLVYDNALVFGNYGGKCTS